MLYRKATYWTSAEGQNWHAFSAENGRDISMGVLNSHEVERSIAWAKSHNMAIDDLRDPIRPKYDCAL